MTKETIKKSLIKNGVSNLKEFGYEHVTISNILNDEVYKMFFKSMLEDNFGVNMIVDEVIEELLKELNSTPETDNG